MPLLLDERLSCGRKCQGEYRCAGPCSGIHDGESFGRKRVVATKGIVVIDELWEGHRFLRADVVDRADGV